MTLAAKVDRACQLAGIEPEHRAFHPHITIARYRRQERALAQDFLQRNRGFATADFTVDRFTLFESRLSRHGAHYEEVASFDLAGRITSVATPAAGTAPPFCYSLRQWP